MSEPAESEHGAASPAASVAATPAALPVPISSSAMQSLANGFVHKQQLSPGDGHIPPDKATVTIHYTAYCDHTQFDNSYARSQPFTFKLGTGIVIRGWDAAVASMSTHERARFVVHPRYAYADRGFTITQRGQALTSAQRGQRSTPQPQPASSPSASAADSFVIPPNTQLTFEIELLHWEHVQKATEDGGVLKQIVRHGDGHQRPNDGAKCRCRWRGRVVSRDDYFDVRGWAEAKADDEATEVVIGSDPHLLLGIEDGLRNMYQNEVALFTFRPDYGYGEAGNEALGIPPAATLQYEIELLSFDKGAETWQLSDEQRIEYMEEWKHKANLSYAASDLTRAIRKYLKVLACFQFDSHLTPPQRQRVYELKVACHANMAMARSREGRSSDVFKHCNEALRMNPSHVKTLFRRGVAYANMHDDDNALIDLSRALSLEPANTAIEVELRAVQQRLEAAKRREQQAFKGMFDERKTTVKDETKVPASHDAKSASEVNTSTLRTVMQAPPPADPTSSNAFLSSEPASSAHAASTSPSSSTASSPSVSPSVTDESAWAVAPPLSAEEEAAYAERVKAQMAGDVVKPFWVQKADTDSVKSWDRFYKRNTDRFFKDRHYLAHEFADLTQQLHTLTAAASSDPPEGGAAGRIDLLEVGCGVGNALFPLRAMFPMLRLHGCDCSKNAIALIRQREEQEAEQAGTTHTAHQQPLGVWVQDIVTEPFPARLHQSMHFATLIFVLSALTAHQHRPVLAAIHALLAPGRGVLYLRDYCVFDYSQLRFGSGSVLGERLYVRADGTRSYFFVLSELEALLVECGYEVLSSSVVERQVENRKEKMEMRRRFVQIRARALTANQHRAVV